jgi:thiamine biosynthesis lipoprotein
MTMPMTGDGLEVVGPVRVPFPSRGPEPRLAESALTVPAMGGHLQLRVAHLPGDDAAAAHDLARVARRVDRWAARLTRFSATSDLAKLNADPARPVVPVRPTLAAVLDWAERATDLAPALLDVTLLDQRLAAERGSNFSKPAPTNGWALRWHLVRGPRAGTVVRHGACRFDLDGVAKGWIADRALDLLRDYPAALVDADGDIALRLDVDVRWDVGVADPRDPDGDDLALLRLDEHAVAGRFGIATSGTSIHRWPNGPDGHARHHLIDPRTRRPAVTDVLQATVIVGSGAAIGLLETAAIEGALLLLAGGRVVTLPGTGGWSA